MDSEPFHPEAHHDAPTDAAVIHPVTSEQLDEAAHRAAQLADDVAHHAAEAPAAAVDAAAAGAAEAHQAVVDTAQAATSEAAEAAGTVGATVAQAARDAADLTGTAATASLDAAGSAVAQVAEASARAGDAAARATDDGLSGTGDLIGRYNAAMLGLIRSNMTATGELFAALVKARSVPEAMAINADHLRRQFDAMTTQGREIVQLAQTLALDALKPLTGTARRDG